MVIWTLAVMEKTMVKVEVENQKCKGWRGDDRFVDNAANQKIIQ